MTDWADSRTFSNALERAETLEKGNYFENFSDGQTIEHAPGFTLSAHANELWMSQTLNHDPVYWRSDAARAVGYDGCPIHPDYLLASVMGPSVEDLSEKGGYFLGRDNVSLHDPAVMPGTEIRVESTVEAKRESSSRPDYGIVTWETTGFDAETDEPLLSYTRTNMIPRREPMASDGGRESPTDSRAAAEPDDSGLPSEFISPDGPYFEDFCDAHERTTDRDAAVAYRHERGRTMDDVMVATLPLVTLNTAKQHHNDDYMTDSPSGEIVAYGDVTRSVALGHARSDEKTYREIGYGNERFYDFVTVGDTIYGFTRVLGIEDTGDPEAGQVTFEHYAFNQRDEPVYSGTRTALIRRRNQ
ncbi:2-methylfumaryl-CoA hydratase [Haladaptatus cibarius]|uniref:2-methylfumaryl-CoA hydratase n=1 Tax=Haladaptatus cibarius TaxID=453847 RepID=UPI000678BBF6|nr:2-methylfumaryl-CoA hydratase [Haladaptatus cibarius]